jgi:ubiquinone/menaquinone biosynthesis C-methylase UbiE
MDMFNERLQKRYDRIATVWNSPAYEGIRKDELIPKLVALLEIKNEENFSVLEAMSGTGLLSQNIKTEAPRASVTALDSSSEMLKQVPENIRVVQTSVATMPFSDKTFDRICLRNGLYDLSRSTQTQAIHEIKRVLKERGIFVLQHYYTTSETFETLNELVRRKDIAGNQNKDVGEERFARYFGTLDELESELAEAGFDFKREAEFQGEIRYMRTDEMADSTSWVSYDNNLPDEIKTAIDLRKEEDGTLTFNFPGIIYRMTA